MNNQRILAKIRQQTTKRNANNLFDNSIKVPSSKKLGTLFFIDELKSNQEMHFNQKTFSLKCFQPYIKSKIIIISLSKV